jgi:trans-4-hydroxy-L-proline dehydratase
MINDNRIKRLREECLKRKKNREGWLNRHLPLIDCASLKETEALDSWQRRVGLRTKARLENTTFEVDENEVLLGRLADVYVSEDEIDKVNDSLAQYPDAPGQTGHCEMDVSKVFEIGISGLIDDLQHRISQINDDVKRDTWLSFIDALAGLSQMIHNAADAAEKRLEEPGENHTSELEKSILSCRRIATNPPETFRDAIQLLWFIDLAIMFGDSVGLVVPGHLDRVLFPFYQQDIKSAVFSGGGAETPEEERGDCPVLTPSLDQKKSGVLSEDEALLLIESLYLLINEFVPDGLAMAIMVGGVDENGHDLTNELSYLSLEALRRTNLVYPTVGVCWHEETPEKLTMLAIELISSGYSTPAFFGDAVIQKGLQYYGVPKEESCYYINSTCVEITPSGSSNIWVASPYFSLCKILLDVIEQVENSDVSGFDEFLKLYYMALAREIKNAVKEQNEIREKRRNFGRKPLQSVFTRYCIETALDIDDGGAKYNWVECSFVGMANLADSLCVIENEVYENKVLTLKELSTILDADFEGFEIQRKRFSEKYPKYGNNNEEVDAFINKTREVIVTECGKYKMEPDASPFVPGAFCWIMHQRLGEECGATPDGRVAKYPFADGGGPAQGREKNGPTSAILSTTSWEHSAFIGGVAFNMKFNKQLFNYKDDIQRLRDLIVTYLKQGGFETQINVLDHDILQKAKENPEEYNDLVVRIGGYTDYFTRLSPEMQNEVMQRTEFQEF